MMHTKSRIFNRLRALPSGSRMAAAFFALALTLSISALIACGSPGGGGNGSDVAVTVTPKTITAFPSSFQEFKAEVTGTGSISQDVEWTIEGKKPGNTNSNGTYILEDGMLIIGADEEVDTEITLMARSETDRTRTGTATVTIVQRPFTVEDVKITPVTTARVARGSSALFQAEVIFNNYSTGAQETVLWELDDNAIAGDSTSTAGLTNNRVRLTVSNDIPAADRTFTLRAISRDNLSVIGEITITVPRPVVNNITISHPGADDEVMQGGTIQFTVSDFDGEYNPPETVEWSIVETAIHAHTTISQTGLLTVSNVEEAAITVRATSTFDDTVYDEIAMTVLELPGLEVESIAINAAYPHQNDPIYINRGDTLVLSAVPTWVNPSLAPNSPWAPEFRWEIEGAMHHDTGFNPVQGSGPTTLTVSRFEEGTPLTVRAIFTWGGIDFSPYGTRVINVRPPVVTNVTVTFPEGNTVQRGGSITPTLTVTGTGNPANTVVWSFVSGENFVAPHENTAFNQTTGVVTVPPDQNPGTLRIRANSTVTEGVYGEASIIVSPPTVDRVTVTPATIEVRRGTNNQQFNAVVGGTGHPPQAVTWEFTGGATTTPGGSSINAAGVLTVHPTEPAASLTVHARSVFAAGVTGPAEATIPPTPTALTIVPVPSRAVFRGAEHQFHVQTTWIGTAPTVQPITWQIIAGNPSANTTISAAGVINAWGREPLGTTQLTVRATVEGYSNVTDTATITVDGPLTVGVWRSVRVGTDHTMAITWNNELWVWGRNQLGQLALGNTGNKNEPQRIGSGWAYASGGWAHTVARRTDGSIWGAGEIRRHDLNQLVKNYGNQFARIGNDNNWSVIQATHSAVFGIRSDGSLWAWGANTNGILGVGDTDNRDEPTLVDNTERWRFVTAGRNHALAITEDGRLFGWGSNSTGQLGNTQGFTGSLSPVQILDHDMRWDTVAAGYGWYEGSWSAGITRHVSGTSVAGELWTWGHNNRGRLGQGGYLSTVNDDEWRPTHQQADPMPPARIGGDNTFRTINMNNTAHGVAIDTHGKLWTWGSNYHGRLGLGLTPGTGTVVLIPTMVEYGSDAPNADNTNISFPIFDEDVPRQWINSIAGGSFSLAIDDHGDLWAWGHNEFGQLGNGFTQGRNRPVRITGGPTAD